MNQPHPGNNFRTIWPMEKLWLALDCSTFTVSPSSLISLVFNSSSSMAMSVSLRLNKSIVVGSLLSYLLTYICTYFIDELLVRTSSNRHWQGFIWRSILARLILKTGIFLSTLLIYKRPGQTRITMILSALVSRNRAKMDNFYARCWFHGPYLHQFQSTAHMKYMKGVWLCPPPLTWQKIPYDSA